MGNIKIVVIFAALSLMLAGCVTNKGIYDTSVPSEQLCTLKIDMELSVHRIDGNVVRWHYRPLTTSVTVKIPAGYHEFVMNYISGSTRYTYYRSNIRYNYTFEAGKTYTMKPKVSGNQVSVEVKIKE